MLYGKNLFFIIKIKIEDGTGYATALGDLLKRGIFIALFDEHIKGFFKDLLFAFCMHNLP